MTPNKPVLVVCDGCWSAWDKTQPGRAISEGSGSLDALVTKGGLGPDDYELSYGYCAKCAAALVQVMHMHHAACEAPSEAPSVHA